MNLKSKLSIVGMSLATFVAFVASTAGTLAWYAYATRASVSFVGTSIRKSELIHIGIVDGTPEIAPTFTQQELDYYDLTREQCGTNSIVWTSSSTGFPTTALKTYLSRSSYAYNSLSPVSSKARTKDGALSLYQSPGYGQTNVTEPAETGQYVRIPFAFKSVSNDGNIPDLPIWLVDTDVQATGQNINKAVRLHVNNPSEQFLINPNVREATTVSTKYTKIAGFLDLDGDNVYDYDPANNNHEYFYGGIQGEAYTGTPTYDDTDPYVKPVDPAQYLPDNVNNIEGVNQNTPMSTFYAKHGDSCIVPDMTGVTIKEAQFYTLGDVKPSLTEEGYFDDQTGKPITITGDDGIGYATLTIYIEGWDHAVINAAIGYQFTLVLTFEVDKVQ